MLKSSEMKNASSNSVGWIRVVVKQRVVEYVTMKLGGGMMQLMML